MATTTNLIFMIFIINFQRPTTAFDNITAIFAFGDSIVDSGNNNNLSLTYTKANFHPYGNDFPGRIPTGRFSNGKLVTDFLVSKVGLKEALPAYMDPKLTDEDLLTGCSFAIGGSGLDNWTAIQYKVPNLTNQLSFFQKAMDRLNKTYGAMKTGRVMENAVFVVVTGSNDVLRNIYQFRFRRYYSVSDYHDYMLGKLENVLERLYDMGARSIAVAGLPPIGCMPLQMVIASMTPSLDLLQYKCVNQQNIDSRSYNAKLQNLIRKIQRKKSESMIEYMDIYTPWINMVENPTAYGFERSDKGCCGTGLIEHGYLCHLTPICSDPSKYLFWDAIHPTEKAYSYLADYFLPLFPPNDTA